jgi:cysteine-S-conjugate beta-lyase
MADFDDISIGELRKRRSAKWTMFSADVLPAWVAEMDFPLDPNVRNALLDSIGHDDCGYANGAGVGPAFAAFVKARYDWTLDPRGVFVIPDVLVGISEILRTLVKPGDRIVVNSPVYPPFYRVVGEVERQIEDVPLLRGEDGSWSFDLAGLERAFAGGAKAYLLCSPHNPLGMVFDLTTLACIAELAKEHNVLVIADEIHAPLTMSGATFVPFLPIADYIDCDAVALASASKAWNLPGLKCAVAIAGSERMRKQLGLMRPELPWSAGNLGVVASIAAFEHGGPWLDELLSYLDANRRLLTDLIARELPGVRYIEPQASYLAWLDCAALELGPDPVGVFLERGRVALTRGRDFGPDSAAFVRVNMGTSAAILTEIVQRMRRAL